MCTFNGIIEGIPDISVDMFGELHLDKKHFFLSHCHTDHMRGFSNEEFLNHLKNSDSFIYCSIISSKIILSQFKEIEKNVFPLSLGNHLIKIKNGYSIEVTLIPAGHCLGSVMFLFKTQYKNILYTGDFNIPSDFLSNISSLFDESKNLINFDIVYFDNTFMDLKHLYFPSRDESINTVIKIFHEWLKDDKCLINLEPSARYVSECFYKPIYLTFGMPIYVDNSLNDIYSLIPDISQCLTNDIKLTRIFLNSKANIQHILEKKPNCYFNKLKLCALSFDTSILEENNSVSINKIDVSKKNLYQQFYKVLFPTHVSCVELIKFLNFLSPKKLEPIVTSQYNTKEEILNFYHLVCNEERFYIEKPATVLNKHFFPKKCKEINEKMESDPIYRFTKSTMCFDPEKNIKSLSEFFN